MCLDMLNEGAFLPAGKPAANPGTRYRLPVIELNKLVCQDRAEGLEVDLLVRVGAFDQSAELLGRLEQRLVLEEQTRRHFFPREVSGTDLQPVGIEVEIDGSRQYARVLPVVVIVARWDEREPAGQIMQRGPWHSFHKGLAGDALAALAYDQQVHWCTEANVDPLTFRRLDDLRRHSVPSPRVPLDRPGWRNPDSPL